MGISRARIVKKQRFGLMAPSGGHLMHQTKILFLLPIDAQYLFSAITANWERKRPIWVTLLVNSLTQSDISSRAYPVLDLYLSQLAVKNRKRVSAVETVEEQCSPLNKLNKTLVRDTKVHNIYHLFDIIQERLK